MTGAGFARRCVLVAAGSSELTMALTVSRSFTASARRYTHSAGVNGIDSGAPTSGTTSILAGHVPVIAA